MQANESLTETEAQIFNCVFKGAVTKMHTVDGAIELAVKAVKKVREDL